MKIINKLSLSILLPVLLTGCAIPGSNLDISSKIIVKSKENDNNILNRVNVYRLTPELVKKHRQSIKAEANPELDAQLHAYQYKVGPFDILNITVWDHPELTIPAGSYRSASEAGNWVRADGTIFYPYIGVVKVAGKTVTEIRNIIARKLSQYIEDPQVDVNVAAFRSQQVYITGSIEKPGKQPITDIPLTLLDAINQAGGLSKDADWRNVTLTRNGQLEHSSMYALIQKGDITQNILLKANDIVHVPNNDGQKVFVMGEVKDPQTLRIDRAGMSLTEALSGVGGINQLQADATGVFVIRADKDKKDDRVASIYQLDIKDATAMVIGTEFDLKPYDIVYVTAAPIVRWNRVIAQILPTLTGINELSETGFNIKSW